jgi:hypothetical protein
MRNLVELCLDDNHLTNDAAIAIAESPYLNKLKKLSLGYNDIKKEGAIALASSENFS